MLELFLPLLLLCEPSVVIPKAYNPGCFMVVDFVNPKQYTSLDECRDRVLELWDEVKVLEALRGPKPEYVPAGICQVSIQQQA